MVVAQVLDKGKKELEKLKKSPIVQLEMKFGANFSVVEGTTLRVTEVIMKLMYILTKNQAERLQQKEKAITVMMAEVLHFKRRKPCVMQVRTDTSVSRQEVTRI